MTLTILRVSGLVEQQTVYRVYHGFELFMAQRMLGADALHTLRLGNVQLLAVDPDAQAKGRPLNPAAGDLLAYVGDGPAPPAVHGDAVLIPIVDP